MQGVLDERWNCSYNCHTHSHKSCVLHNKDMYTFDVSEEGAIATYHDVCRAYESIFRALSLPVVKGVSFTIYQCPFVYCTVDSAVKAATGNIGGSLSHEYHVVSSVGEDTLVFCHRWEILRL